MHKIRAYSHTFFQNCIDYEKFQFFFSFAIIISVFHTFVVVVVVGGGGGGGGVIHSVVCFDSFLFVRLKFFLIIQSTFFPSKPEFSNKLRPIGCAFCYLS
jgi:hypothetical protein